MSSKGVTPVIATVLLITISIAATGTAYTFIMGAQDQVREGFEDQFNQDQLESQTDFEIEHVYNNSGDAIMIVRNTGTVPIRIQKKNDDGSTQKVWTLYAGTSGQKPVDEDNWNIIDESGEVILPTSDTLSINTGEIFPSSDRKTFKLVGRYGEPAFYTCPGGGSSC